LSNNKESVKEIVVALQKKMFRLFIISNCSGYFGTGGAKTMGS